MAVMMRSARGAVYSAALALTALGLTSTTPWAAQKGKPEGAAPADPKAAQAEAAKRSYDSGVKAYTSGKHQNAVDQLSVALRGGGLTSAEMARGLYYRGLAYKKLSKPGLAISDLTSALWLKNGLSEAERKSALAERAEAYKAAGLGDGNSGADAVARSDPQSETGASAAGAGATVPAPVPSVAAGSQAQASAAAPGAYGVAAGSDAGGIPQPLSLGGEAATAPPLPRTARSEAGGNIDQAATIEQPYASTAAVPAAPPSAQPVLSAAPMEQAPATGGPGGGTSTVAGFFSNLFSGSGSGGPSPPPAPVTTASTEAAPGAPQTSSWSDSTSLSQSNAKTKKAASEAAQAAGPVKTAAAAPAAAAPAAAKVKGGKYKLHIAAVRSREEADALAHRLMSEHGAAFASRTASVDEAVIGSMGKFYRVRVGSYATADEPRGLCNTLRNSGYDCLVVSN